MTTTEIYTVNEAGDVMLYDYALNSWHGAMAIWNAIWVKYLQPTYRGSMADLHRLALKERGEPPRLPFMDNAELERLWALGNDGSPLQRYELMTVRTTFDRVIVRKADIPMFVNALKMFEAELEEVSNLPKQIEILNTIYDDPDEVAVCWNQTSVVADTWDAPCPQCEGEGCTVCKETGTTYYNVNTGSKHKYLEVP